MKRTVIAVLVALFLGFALGNLLPSIVPIDEPAADELNQTLESPYAGEEVREITSLSADEVAGLLAGEGTPFGGMAKLAELNGYPGPRHALNMTQELELRDGQVNEIESVLEQMQAEAVPLGEEIVALEQKLDEQFASGEMSEEALQRGIYESAEVYGRLRFMHLKYHLAMMEILEPEQIERYNQLRGYAGETDPCETIPEGHDPEMWKMHNECV